YTTLFRSVFRRDCFKLKCATTLFNQRDSACLTAMGHTPALIVDDSFVDGGLLSGRLEDHAVRLRPRGSMLHEVEQAFTDDRECTRERAVLAAIRARQHVAITSDISR